MLYKFDIRDVNSTNTSKIGGGSSLSIGSDEKLELWPANYEVFEIINP